MPADTVRCTYCLQTKAASAFNTVEHIVPAAIGGAWETNEVCDSCQTKANEVSDNLINRDFLTVFLRSAYEIGDRYGHVPRAPRFDVQLKEGGGVVKVTIDQAGAVLEGAMSPETASLLGLVGSTAEDQERLRELVGDDVRERLQNPVELARLIQPEKTPPEAWSRFVAKLALACGRDGYGDSWLDSPHARALSRDLLSAAEPKLSYQRDLYPPVGDVWPFEPPKHVMWIEDFQDIAMLHIALFGQVLAGVALNAAGAPSEHSAWRLDPIARTMSHSSYPAIWVGTLAARATQAGHDVFAIADDSASPFVYVADGPDGPMDIPGETIRANSPSEALQMVAEQRGMLSHQLSGGPDPLSPPQRPGRNEPCWCGSGIKFKRCHGL